MFLGRSSEMARNAYFCVCVAAEVRIHGAASGRGKPEWGTVGVTFQWRH